MQVVKGGEHALVAILKVLVNGFLDNTDGVGGLVVEVDPDLLKNVVGHVVGGVAGDHLCLVWRGRGGVSRWRQDIKYT